MSTDIFLPFGVRAIHRYIRRGAPQGLGGHPYTIIIITLPPW